MKGAIETFVGIVIIALMVVISTGYITASLDIRHAQNFHSSMVSEIEESDFSQEVINECILNAQLNHFVKEDGSSGLDVKTAEGMDIAEVTLTYTYTIPFLNSVLEHEIVGYAR